jgi:hypothetical protein
MVWCLFLLIYLCEIVQTSTSAALSSIQKPCLQNVMFYPLFRYRCFQWSTNPATRYRIVSNQAFEKRSCKNPSFQAPVRAGPCQKPLLYVDVGDSDDSGGLGDHGQPFVHEPPDGLDAEGVVAVAGDPELAHVGDRARETSEVTV